MLNHIAQPSEECDKTYYNKQLIHPQSEERNHFEDCLKKITEE